MWPFKRDNLDDLRSEEWEKAFQNMRFRAEQESLSSLVFVDSLRILTSVKGRQNILLMGRRGTGKTSLLLKLYTEYLTKFRRDTLFRRQCDFLPISIHIGKLSSIPLQDPEENVAQAIPSPATQAVGNFRRIIQMILRGYDEIGGLQKYVNEYRLGILTRRNARRSLIELERYLSEGENQIRSIERELSQRRADNLRLIAAASAKIQNNPLAPIAAELRSGLEADENFGREWSEKIFATAQLSLNEISNRLVDVVKSLRCKQMLLLIDEWSSGQNPIESQPFLLELMKSLFFSNPAISTKMAIVPESYREYDGARGLEPHSGYFVPKNLDDLQPYGRNQEKTKKVMCEIVSAHLRSQMGQTRLPRGFRIIESFFKDDKLLSRTVVASEGNIRDFLLIIARIYQQFLSSPNTQQAFSLGNVNGGIAEHFQLDKWKYVEDERLRSIFIKLCSTIENREIRVADVPEQDQGITNMLNTLRTLRLLHSSREPLLVESQLYRFFIIDAAGYAYVSDKNSEMFDRKRRKPTEPTPDASPSSIQIIDPSLFITESR